MWVWVNDEIPIRSFAFGIETGQLGAFIPRRIAAIVEMDRPMRSTTLHVRLTKFSAELEKKLAWRRNEIERAIYQFESICSLAKNSTPIALRSLHAAERMR